MIKYGRNYLLRVEASDGEIVQIRLPFTIQFDITRNTLTSANVCQIKIFNLSPLNRNRIRYNLSNYGQLRGVELYAGYGDNMPRIFRGNISQAWSVKETVDYITTIECFDGGFAFINGRTAGSFPKGSIERNVMIAMTASLPGVKPGAIGDYPRVLSRGNSYSGITMSILNEISGSGAFIDDGKVNILNTNEYISNKGSSLVIRPESGLLGTPVLEQTIVRFQMIFEPQLNVGTKVVIESESEKNFNGKYKCTAVKHRGIISGTHAGELITEGEFFYTKRLVGVTSL